ncbi:MULTISPECIES: hypothetical protein [unclassified Rhizobium]|uniref:hypothetical protein n=1 Tax=unclassified Rhizobium TaxID=2613769 RepID=UPI001FDA0412|nr:MULTISPECIES: hypothetical protein [unclassified Rhizobium]
MAHGKRHRPGKPAAVDDLEKQAIVTARETFIRDVLKPRFLPEIRPAEWNYAIDIQMRPSPVSTGRDRTASTSSGCGILESGGGCIPGSS